MGFNYRLVVTLLVFTFMIGLVSSSNLAINTSQGSIFSSKNVNISYIIDSDNVYDTCSYSLNGGSSTDCGSKQVGSNVLNIGCVEGNNFLNITIIKNNDDPTSIDFGSIIQTLTASVSFIVDTIAPTISISSPLDGKSYNRNNLPFIFNISDSGPYTCLISYSNISNTTSCTSGNIPPIREGLNILSIAVNDTFGRVDIKNVTFNYDSNLPIVNISMYQTYNSIVVNYNANEAVNFSIRYDSDYYPSSLSYKNEMHKSAYDISKQIIINSLRNNTLYYYRIQICDNASNCIYFPNAVDGSILTNATSVVDPVVNTTSIVNTSSCNTTYSCDEWHECNSENIQIRTCMKVNPNCDASIPDGGFRRSCIAIPLTDARLLTVVSTSANETNTIGTNSDSVWMMILKTIILVGALGLIGWLGYKGYNYFKNPKKSKKDDEYPGEISEDELDDLMDR